jgi:hypothetical protein
MCKNKVRDRVRVSAWARDSDWVRVRDRIRVRDMDMVRASVRVGY